LHCNNVKYTNYRNEASTLNIDPLILTTVQKSYYQLRTYNISPPFSQNEEFIQGKGKRRDNVLSYEFEEVITGL
jgi:hypothetical protein